RRAGAGGGPVVGPDSRADPVDPRRTGPPPSLGGDGVTIRRPEPSSWLRAAVLAALAFVPLFISRPGYVSSDTYDGLYINSARTLNQAASRWDPSTGLGTLADRSFNHAFPMSLWYRGFDLVGVPDWVA